MANTTPSERTIPLYQRDSALATHKTTLSSLQPLSSYPAETQSLFKAQDENLYVLTAPETIFHAQGGGQPSDTGSISLATVEEEQAVSEGKPVFEVQQVRFDNDWNSILHVGKLTPKRATEAFQPGLQTPIIQTIDTEKRTLHSRLHTAGHTLSLAINRLSKASTAGVPADLTELKASHYPGSAFVEFSGLIPGTAKQAIQDAVDELVAQDLGVYVWFWSEEVARKRCAVVLDGVGGKAGEEGVRVVEIGGDGKDHGEGKEGEESGAVGSYPCGGTHVRTLKELGRVVVRGIKRQKGVSKVSYEVADA